MENFTKENLIEMIKFYKNKTSDIELQYLILQLNSRNELQASIQKIKEELSETFDKERKILINQISELKKSIIQYEKKLKKNQPVKK